MGLVFGLTSSLVWGTADFLGGVYTRRLTLASVTVGSQIAGLAVLLVIVALIGGVEGRPTGIGLAAGACGAIGLSAFYQALATGTISIVSPVSACGALVPVGLALRRGNAPAPSPLAGSAVGLAGAVLASVHEIRGDHPAARSSIGLAMLAALGIGGFLWFLGRAADGGHTLSALLGARLGRWRFSASAWPSPAARSRSRGRRSPPSPSSASSTPRPTGSSRWRPARLHHGRLGARLGVPRRHRDPGPSSSSASGSPRRSGSGSRSP